MSDGLSNAATTPDGVSHWGDAKVVASLAAAAVLLAAFAVIAPGRSNRPARRPVAGSTRVARAATASPMGTLTNITHRQLA